MIMFGNKAFLGLQKGTLWRIPYDILHNFTVTILIFKSLIITYNLIDISLLLLNVIIFDIKNTIICILILNGQQHFIWRLMIANK